MDALSLTFPIKLTVDDMALYNQIVCRRQPNSLITIVIIFASCFLAASLLIALKIEDVKSVSSIFVFAAAILIGLKVFGRLFRTSMFQNLYRPDGFTLAEKLCTFAPDGMTFEHPHSLGTVKWPLVKEIIDGKDAVYILIDTMLGYIIPYRCLPPSVTPVEFTAMLRRYQQQATT